MTWDDGRKYVGGWKNDNQEGDGCMTYADGRTYDGKWKNGIQEGDGTMTYANGRRYVGQWENGKREGKGKETWPDDGKEYIGLWKEGKITGEGKMKYSDDGTSWIVEEVNETMVRRGSYTLDQRVTKIENWLKRKRDRNEVVVRFTRKKSKTTSGDDVGEPCTCPIADGNDLDHMYGLSPAMLRSYRTCKRCKQLNDLARREEQREERRKMHVYNPAAWNIWTDKNPFVRPRCRWNRESVNK